MEKSLVYEGVVISGGGIKGILTLGALHYYYEKGKYKADAVQAYSATSVGSAISLLLSCGYTPMDIFMQVYQTSDLFSISGNIFDIVNGIGVLSIESFSSKIKELIIKKLGSVPTFLELYVSTGKKISITASNVTKMKAEYYKVDTHPDMSVLLAMELSCCLPIIFQRMKYQEDYISDGSFVNNVPIEEVDNGKRKILTIVTSSDDYNTNDDDFLPYIYKLMSLPMDMNNELRLKSIKMNPNIDVIKIRYTGGIFESSISEDKKMDMFTVGYQTAEYKDQKSYLFVEGM